ncbi:MAG TPA: CYTH domain-containing protein [Candidatus Hydrogenedentes bacterium]|nr:CYTH domain-containing protein [Candidatus Hydrogenedentota bacterium]HOS03875.1 CYTH domain-containing protein [Candidatus Hydrogenedentota bacterium]
MGYEIERKFLVMGDAWREGAAGASMRQGYLCLGPPSSVRVRIEGSRAFLNVKQSTLAITRAEFDYPIPLADAEAMLVSLCVGAPVVKTRYRVPYEGFMWEVDVFEGANAPLVLAEIELASADQAFAPPPWIGAEVSGDPRYLNTHLSVCPFSQW